MVLFQAEQEVLEHAHFLSKILQLKNKNLSISQPEK